MIFLTMKFVISLSILVVLLKLIGSENVLILHPFYGGSHLLTMRRLSEALTQKNHKITIVRWLDTNTYAPISNPNITEWVLSVNNSDNSIPLVTQEDRGRFNLPVRRMWEKGLTPAIIPPEGYLTLAYYCKALLENKDLINHLQNSHFKVAIVDLIFNDCGLGLSYKLGLPIIGFWGLNWASAFAPESTAFNPPSSLPQTLSSLKDEMSFMERVSNTVYMMILYFLLQAQHILAHHVIKNSISDAPYPSTIIANMSGLLINSHPAVDYPRLLPPSFLEVAGIHMRPTKELPEDILSFIESSGDDGVILFSLGFNFDANHIPKWVFEAYFRAFRKLKQKVIVKAKGRPSYVPPNVKIYSYFPQADILAHNKTILFISHCGIHGVMEAIHNIVPIVGIPIFFDQRDNLVRLVQLGVAKDLSKESTEDQIYEAVTSVINDERYKENMKKLSKRVTAFGDPLEKAVWLVEHVIDTDGADHLKLASRHLGIIQYLCFDVFLFLLIASVAFIFVVCKVVSKVSHGFRDKHFIKRKLS